MSYLQAVIAEETRIARSLRRGVSAKMGFVLWYVADHPGCTKSAAGQFASFGMPLGLDNGVIYGPVNACIRRGLISASTGKRGAYALTLTEAGKKVLAAV